MEKISFYHSPARRAIRGATHTITVAANPGVQAVSAVVGGEKQLLNPAGEREGLRLWQGKLLPPPGADVLTYTLYADLSPMGSYSIPLDTPRLAPLAITELCLNMKASPTTYVEVVNTTDAPIDLGGYQLMWQMVTPGGGAAPAIMPIAPCMGQEILPPRAVAVLWLAFASSHNPKAPCLTATDFCARLEADFRWRNFVLSPDTIRIIRIEGAEEDETGAWHEKPGLPAFPKLRAWDTVVLGIAPLGGSLDRAVCRMTVNALDPDHWDWQSPIRQASLWQPDPFGGAEMRCIRNVADLTPGTLDAGQIIPNLAADRPACIIPLGWPEEHPLADGALTLRFFAEGAGSCRATLCDLDRALLATRGEDGVWSLTLPADLLGQLGALQLRLEADCGTYITDSEFPPIKLIDNAGPVVTTLVPENGYAAMAGAPVEFTAGYYDRAGVDAYASHLYLDGIEASQKAVWTGESVYCSFAGLKPGKHKIALKLYDCLGNASRTVSYFTVAASDVMYCYRGEVHAHTGDSDGVATPADAIRYARDEGGADYFAVTDHSHYLSDTRYADQQRVADEFNEAGKYAVLRGWEMTWNNETGYWGHINVLETDDVCHDIYKMDMPQLFDYLAARPGSVGMFNHPGYNWGNFNEYACLTPVSDAVMCLDEIKGPSYDLEYALALTKGWHLGPVSNEDNHAYNWTTATSQTGYVLAPGLTRQNVMEAFRARRTYTTSDPSLHLRFRVNGAWMGSRIPATDTLTVEFRLDTTRPEGLGVISLIGEDNITVAVWDVGAAQHFEQRIHLPADFDYYYLKAINPLVPKDYTVCAPVWIEGRDKLAVDGLELALTGGDQPNLVSLSIANRGDVKLTGLRADFYLTPASGFSLTTAHPYHTVYLGDLEAGESVRTARTFPNLTGRRRVSVILSAMAGKQRVVDTAYLLLTPASIVEVLPDSSNITLPDGRTVTNPYAYAVLFNHTNAPLSLDGASLRQWTATGKAPTPENIHPLNGIVIPARSAAVLWTRSPDSPLTADDFNAHYDTALVEGKSLFILEGLPLSNTHTASRRLDLQIGTEVVSRVHWNYANDAGKQPVTDCALRYGYHGGMTATAPLLDANAKPVPGQLEAGQMPAARAYQASSVELRRARKVRKKITKQTRKPEKKGVKPGKVTALSLGTAAAGLALGAGSVLAAILIGQKKGGK